MTAIAIATRPPAACLVPERREERTTEGGLDVVAHRHELADVVAALGEAKIRVSLFIAPDERQIEGAVALNAPVIEIHTGAWCDAVTDGETARAAAETVRTIGADPKHLGAEIGMIAILHSWGQTLTHHPHVHCIVPGGGLAPDGRWIACRPGFFLPVHVLSRLYRRLFLERLLDAFADGRLSFFGNLAALAEPAAFARHLAPLRRIAWVVYAKRPFGGAEQVLDYLGRYTHRVKYLLTVP